MSQDVDISRIPELQDVVARVLAEARSAGGSNCTGVEIARIHGPRAVSNSR